MPGVGLALMRQLARRLRESGGALLAIDYGHSRPGFGDTLQALSGHRFTDPLAAPGDADLTHHVDFAALAKAAQARARRFTGRWRSGISAALGLNARAERLKARASPAQAAAIDAAVERLTDASPTGMGNLFKVLAVTGPGLGPLPGFPEA